MTSEIVSASTFGWIMTILTGGISVWLVFYDIYNMSKLRKLETTALVRDRYFGYGVGIVIAIIGIVGTLKFNHVL